MDQYGITVRTRRRALNQTQFQLARATGRSPAWIGRLENLQCAASDADKRLIEAFLQKCEHAQSVALPSSAPHRSEGRAARG